VSAVGRWEIVGVGMLLTILACCMGAVQMLVGKMAIVDVHPNLLVFYRTAGGALVIGLWVLLTGKADFCVEPRYWASTLLGAFLGPCLSFLFFFRSFRYWDLSRTTMVKMMEPLFALPLVFLFFGKVLSGKELAGGLIILAGSFWLVWIHMRRSKN